MPHTKTAKKRLRQNEKRRQHNRSVASDLRTAIKKLLVAVKDGRKDDATALLRNVQQRLDKCAARRYLHPNTAFRYKSRLTRRVNAIGAPAPSQVADNST